MREVVEDGGGVLVAGDDLEHLPRLVERYLLRVARVGHWLVLVVLQTDVTQLAVGHVLDKDPAYVEPTLPLIL